MSHSEYKVEPPGVVITHQVEFKSTVRWNVRDKRMEDAIAKTVAD